MIIKAVKFVENGFYSQPFVMGGEDGAGRFDKNVHYRGSLQNYVIDTGDDVILVDTGLPKGTPLGTYDPNGAAFMGSWIRDYVSALAKVGYRPDQVTKILVTHKHADHTGEIKSFPNAKVYVNRIELETDELKALADHKGITPVDFIDGPYYNFTRSQIIAPGVRMIPAPGHTFGNSIIIVEDGDKYVMIHGDITYTDEAMYADRLSIVADDIHLARSTQNTIRAFIKDHPTVYCGTHTPLGYENLEARKVMDLDNPPKTIWPDEDSFVKEKETGRYICSVCGYVYDPAEHDGLAFEDLPEDWKCPRCKQSKDKFNKA
jgi:N-acyl homoserine lactone hydrolase